MKSKKIILVILIFFSLFLIIFMTEFFSSKITTLTTKEIASSDVLITTHLFDVALEQYKSGGSFSKVSLVILMLILTTFIAELYIRKSRGKITNAKKIKYLIDAANHELDNSRLQDAQLTYQQITREYDKLDEESKEIIKEDCLELYEKLNSII